MGLGNRNAKSGDQGSNYKIDLKTLQGLDAIVAAINGSVTRTPALIRDNGPDTIAAGAKSVSIYNAGGATGTVLGTNLLATERVTFSAEDKDVLAAIVYDATGTEFLIATLV